MANEVLFAIGVLVAVWQFWVSMKLLRAPQYEPRQKWLQFALIWLLPILGAAVIHAMLRSEGGDYFLKLASQSRYRPAMLDGKPFASKAVISATYQ